MELTLSHTQRIYISEENNKSRITEKGEKHCGKRRNCSSQKSSASEASGSVCIWERVKRINYTCIHRLSHSASSERDKHGWTFALLLCYFLSGSRKP